MKQKPNANLALLNDTELNAIASDMRKLFDDFRKGDCDRLHTDSAANVAGKNLKAQGLILSVAQYNYIVTNKLHALPELNPPQLPDAK